MKNLLLFFIVALLFAACREAVQDSLKENEELKEKEERKYGTTNYKLTYEKDAPNSKAMAFLLDSTLSKESAEMLVRFNTDRIILNNEYDRDIIIFILIRELSATLKELSKAKDKPSSSPADNAPASLQINAEIVKEWMKKNPQNAKMIVRDLLKENVFD
jgi:hypothetical protein